MKKVIAAVLMLAVATAAQARIVRMWSYQELYDQSDLVVIAKPTATHDTNEKSILKDISPNVPVIGVSTEFSVSLVIKGSKATKFLTMHHYRLANPRPILLNGPALTSFDLTKHRPFLLFLHREADGRYSPASGQTDPMFFSVQMLGGIVQ
jgi:hypothetical protein